MLFNSYEFLLLFLPVTLFVFFRLENSRRERGVVFLVAASLFFYGYWEARYLILIAASMLGNFAVGRTLSAAREQSRPLAGRCWLIGGVCGNLALLGYFKYSGFLAGILNQIAGTALHPGAIVLPLAISFFTFQQIAYLVDAHRGITSEYRFSHYALFVTFFPQLIAGPIVHHKDVLPQFGSSQSLRAHLPNISIGLSIFFIGLFKKAVIADGVAGYGTPVFDAAAGGESLDFMTAWGGALAYTFQLYFDFSGYSDMAIGAARMFGIRLPVNFHSPYKAVNISEFWRRWHITLSTFLRDYLYIPLGGNRRGKLLRYRNLLLTMVLGGLWHGAGWTFVAWGALHGLYLCVHHAWARMWRNRIPRRLLSPALSKALAWFATFLAVVVAWVFFRAKDFAAARAMLEGMAGLNGVAIPNAIAVRLGGAFDVLAGWGITAYIGGGSQFLHTWLCIALLLPVALILPNTQQLLERYAPAIRIPDPPSDAEIRPLEAFCARLRWSPTVRWAAALGILAAMGILALTRISEFLYFQF